MDSMRYVVIDTAYCLCAFDENIGTLASFMYSVMCLPVFEMSHVICWLRVACVMSPLLRIRLPYLSIFANIRVIFTHMLIMWVNSGCIYSC